MLPQTVSGWVRSDTFKTVTAKSIFEYMDGAGELYLGYRFDRLYVFSYSMPGQDDILVELYSMKSAEDAFGLLSLDWSGEPAVIDEGKRPPPSPESVPRARALYGSGLLRIWSGDLFIRIMADRETPESHRAVFSLGKICVQGRKPAAVPGWMKSLPPSLCGRWNLEKDQVRFLRTHLALNSVYFLSYSNILGLDLSTEVAAGRYRIPQKSGENPPLHIFSIRYNSTLKAREALAGFHQTYYPEYPLRPEESSSSKPVLRPTENKWSGYVLNGPYAVLGFEFLDESSLKDALTEVIRNIQNQIGGQS